MNENLETDLIILLTQVNNKIQKRLSGSLSLHGISFTEYLLLRQLNQAPNKKLRRIDLAESVGLSASGVTRLLNPMEKIGLIDKEEVLRDARVSLVVLTAAGEQIFADAHQTFRDVSLSMLSALNPAQEATLSEVLCLMS